MSNPDVKHFVEMVRFHCEQAKLTDNEKMMDFLCHLENAGIDVFDLCYDYNVDLNSFALEAI